MCKCFFYPSPQIILEQCISKGAPLHVERGNIDNPCHQINRGEGRWESGRFKKVGTSGRLRQRTLTKNWKLKTNPTAHVCQTEESLTNICAICVIRLICDSEKVQSGRLHQRTPTEN